MADDAVGVESDSDSEGFVDAMETVCLGNLNKEQQATLLSTSVKDEKAVNVDDITLGDMKEELMAGDGDNKDITSENRDGENEQTIDAKECLEHSDESDDDTEKDSAGDEIDIDEQALKDRDAELNEDQIEGYRVKGQELKSDGNKLFMENQYSEAIVCYTEALKTCPLQCLKERSIMYSNRAACKMHLDEKESSIGDCSKALELHPNYSKALRRRAELYEKTDKLDEALSDYQKLLEMDESQLDIRHICIRLSEEIQKRNEKLKEEMMGKLKELGNLVLRPFGLSTENFQLQQNPDTGSYSVNFQQGQPQASQRQAPTATDVPSWATQQPHDEDQTEEKAETADQTGTEEDSGASTPDNS